MEPSERHHESEPHVLGYAPAARGSDPPLRWWPALTSIGLAVLVAPMFACACGHLDELAFSVTLPACALACFGWVSNKNRNLLGRLFLMGAVVLSVMVFLKNAGDVLWFGHDPLLGG